MSIGLIFLVTFLVFIMVVLARSVRVVPPDEEWVVERLGKPFATFRPGLNLLLPFVDKIVTKKPLTPEK